MPRLFKREMSCSEIMEVLQSYLDGETDASVARKVASHLRECKRCDTESGVYDRIRQSLGNREIEVDPQVMEALTEFGRNLAQDGPSN